MFFIRKKEEEKRKTNSRNVHFAFCPKKEKDKNKK